MNASRRVAAFLFDLGKTLMVIPEEYALEPRLAELLELDKPLIIEELIYRLCADNMNMSAEEFVEQLCRELNPDSRSKLDHAIRIICNESVQHAYLQPNAKKVLAELRDRGFKTILVSNTSPLTKTRLERLGLKPFFDRIILSCDVGMIKPDPRIYLLSIKVLDLKPKQVCIIADKVRPIILGGAILGCRLVYLDWHYDTTVANGRIPVDAIIPDLSEIVKLPLAMST